MITENFFLLLEFYCAKKHVTLFRNNFEHIGNVEQYRKFYVKFSETEPHSRNPRLLTYRRQELVSITIET